MLLDFIITNVALFAITEKAKEGRDFCKIFAKCHSILCQLFLTKKLKIQNRNFLEKRMTTAFIKNGWALGRYHEKKVYFRFCNYNCQTDILDIMM